jgi:hypothetical protein
MDVKKLVASVALAGAITAGTAGAAFAADGSASGSSDPSAQTPSAQAGRRHPGLRREIRRAGAKIVADTLGVSVEDLRAALKGGQSISSYATSLGKDPQAVVDALVKAADTKLDQLAADGKLSQERVDTIKGKVPERVDKIVNHVFGQHAPAQPQV